MSTKTKYRLSQLSTLVGALLVLLAWWMATR